MSRSSAAAKKKMKSAVPGGDVTAGSGLRKLFYRGIAVYILSFIFFALFARIGIDPHHDGVMMIPAFEVELSMYIEAEGT